ncbi:uncharacterized protein EDB91DRAFT_223381 [Suillus paluster]|uniref:uncharacterized protein n=1 Tax=Suillus paluster TaxID=48578 RepID=UPI001B87554D|nr:uncharacterized protein EDB91DRAFT_223381 [Suillus paluster]KAG1743717.1 hypothetical protein EDB91DRAFT_223381 [Suillus paluster]
MLPHLDEPPKRLPMGAADLGDGYALLCKRERTPSFPQGAEKEAIQFFLNGPSPRFFKWARLKLPNGQIARSLWRESLRPPDRLPVCRNVKFTLDGTIRFGEVRYFTRLVVRGDGEDQWVFVDVAIVTVYSLPDPNLLKSTSPTPASSTSHGDNEIRVINVKCITDVIPTTLVKPPPATVVTVPPGGPSSTTSNASFVSGSTGPGSPSDAPHAAASSKRPRKMRPGPKKYGRNLCASRWLKQVTLSGSAQDFNIYYSQLNYEQIKVCCRRFY